MKPTFSEYYKYENINNQSKSENMEKTLEQKIKNILSESTITDYIFNGDDEVPYELFREDLASKELHKLFIQEIEKAWDAALDYHDIPKSFNKEQYLNQLK